MTSAKLIVAYPQPRDVEAMRGVSRRKGNSGACGKNLVGRAAGNHGRGRGFIDVLIGRQRVNDRHLKAAHGNSAQAKLNLEELCPKLCTVPKFESSV
jgi:hypothetical protein